MAALQFRAAVIAPLRRQRLHRLAANGQAPPMVAFYHRVADKHPNRWTIGTKQFDRHLDHFQRHFDAIDLAEVQRRVVGGHSDRPSISVTFDDGYAENGRHALPELLRRRIPVTYFVSTSNVSHNRAFTHDLVAGRPLPVHSKSSLRMWSDAGVEIGGHTRNHVNLAGATDRQFLIDQIIDDRKRLQDIIGRDVRFFAFPFGMPAQMHAHAIEAVARAGYRGYCSAFGGYNQIGGDAFHIRRFHGDPAFGRLINWLSLDQSKMQRQPQLDFVRPNQWISPDLSALIQPT